MLFFRNQDLDIAQLKELAKKLSDFAGAPAESGLHRHPLSSKDNPKNHDENGKTDEEVFFVSSVVSQLVHKLIQGLGLR